MIDSGQQNEKELMFETKLQFKDKFLAILQIILGLGLALIYLSTMTKSQWGGQFFIASFFILFAIQGIRTTKTFLLFQDKLIVKRPFFFTNSTDIVFKIDEIKEIIFRNIKGRFGGKHIIIKSKKLNESYRIDFPEKTLGEFIFKLTELGVKTSKDNM